jgi:small subunit ribosomal protein S8
MLITDPIADMLTRIRNALVAKHDTVEVPASNMKLAIAEILLNEGYIKSYTVNEEGVEKMMTIVLKYGPNKQRVITGLKRVSKPGLRVYARKDKLPRVLNGLGIAIISTSKGIMTDREARNAGVGGEVLAYIW